MFCSNCGAKESGNYCSQCGAKLEVAQSAVQSASACPVNWQSESCYETLIAHPLIRDRIARHAALAKPGFTGEMVLDAFDKVTRNPVPSKAIAAMIQPLYARIGIATGKSQERVLRHPVGAVIVSALCSLAQNGQTVTAVVQDTDGCKVEAKFPSDVFALEGNLIVTIRRIDVGTHLEAATRIPGQWFDWGKSNRCLKRLIAEIEAGLNADEERPAMSA